MRARAFAFGPDIYFGPGQFAPSSRWGEQLLAHEVAHTVQQGNAGTATQTKLEVSGSGDPHEVEAEAAAEAMMRGVPSPVSSRPYVIARRAAGAEHVETAGGQLAEERHGAIKEIDEMRAGLVEVFRDTALRGSSRDIVQEARRLDEKLWRPHAEVGPREKSAIAETLMAMYHVLEKRMLRAPRDAQGRLQRRRSGPVSAERRWLPARKPTA